MSRTAIPLIALTLATSAASAQVAQAPDRRTGEGEGPFQRLIIRGATMVDGTGAPAQGPVDIVIVNNRITEIRGVGSPGLPIDARRWADRVRDRKSTRLNSSHGYISYAVFCLKKKKTQ